MAVVAREELSIYCSVLIISGVFEQIDWKVDSDVS